MTPNPRLPIWQAICAAPVIGQIGHHVTQAGGQAHPTTRPAPAWVTPTGCALRLLQVAYAAHCVSSVRVEDSSARLIARHPRRAKRAAVLPMRARRSA
jgi:hypothetical protein